MQLQLKYFRIKKKKHSNRKAKSLQLNKMTELKRLFYNTVPTVQDCTIYFNLGIVRVNLMSSVPIKDKNKILKNKIKWRKFTYCYKVSNKCTRRLRERNIGIKKQRMRTWNWDSGVKVKRSGRHTQETVLQGQQESSRSWWSHQRPPAVMWEFHFQLSGSGRDWK